MSNSEDDVDPKQEETEPKESQAYKRARYDAYQLMDFGAKAKDGDSLRESVAKIIDSALVDEDQDTEALIALLREK